MSRFFCHTLFKLLQVTIIALTIYSQTLAYDGQGMPPYSFFPNKQTFGTRKSFDFVQNQEKLLFCASNSGLLVLNGKSWSSIDLTAHNADIGNLFVSNDNRIWLSNYEEFGYLEYDEKSIPFLKIVSSEFETELKNKKGWYVRHEKADGTLMIAADSTLIAWHPEKGITNRWDGIGYSYSIFEMGDRMFTQTDYPVIAELFDDGVFEPIPEPPKYAGLAEARSSIQCPDGKVLLASEKFGVVQFDGTHYNLILDKRTNPIDRATQITGPIGDNYFITEKSGGITSFNLDGEINWQLNSIDGRNLTEAQSLYADQDGGLWFGQKSGIYRLDLSQDISIFNFESNEIGNVQTLLEHRGKVFLGCENQVYQHIPNTTERYPFKAIKGPEGITSLTSYKELLIIGAANGVFAWDESTLTMLSEVRSNDIVQDPEDDSILWQVASDGIAKIQLDPTNNKHTRQVIKPGLAGLNADFDSNGFIWIFSGLNDIARFDPQDTESEIRYYGEKDGIPKSWKNLYIIDGVPIVTVYDFALELEKSTDKWIRSESYAYFPNHVSTHTYLTIVQDPQGQLWVNGEKNPISLIPHPKTNISNALRQLEYGPSPRALSYLSSTSHWMGCNSGLVRIDPTPQPKSTEANVFVLSIMNTDTGKTVYSHFDKNTKELVIPSDLKSFRLDLATNDYETIGNAYYHVFLENYTDKYSGFTEDNYRVFTNLRYGTHTAYIQSQNGNSRFGKRTSFTFTIATPWYHQRWALVIYSIFAVSLIYLLIWWRLRASEQKQKDLEHQISKRTEELKAAVKEAENLTEKAKSGAKAKSQFLANMSHEIRTPMNGVMGMCTLLQDSKLDTSQKDYVSTIRVSGESLLTIINDILDFSKIEAGKMSIEKISYDVSELIEDVLDLLSTQASEKNVELLYRIRPNVEQTQIGDPTRIRQILVNLIGNGIKFTKNGQVFVEIDYHAKNNELVFKIMDDGIGMPPEKMSSLFEAFSQADSSTTRKFGGTGLGLTISKMLVQLMGGRIWVESEQGKGSTFSFTIENNPDLKSPKEEVSNNELEDTRILVIDDNAINRLILREHLAELNVTEQFEAPSGAKALEILATDTPINCIILDHQMPEMTGLETLKKIRAIEKHKQTPTLLLSPTHNYKISLKKEQAQNVFTLSKPIRRIQLREALHLAFGIILQTNNTAKTTNRKPNISPTLEILLAEDNVVNQKVARLFLKRIGIIPDVVNNGAKAVKACKQNKYDVVLMDVQMPEMDGLEATRRIRKLANEVTQPLIYAMTAAASELDNEVCIAAGMDGFIRKPVKVSELIEALEEANKTIAQRNKHP